VSWTLHRLGREGAPDVSASIHRFRDQLGVVIRGRGLAALAVSIASQFAWVVVLTVAMRMTGVPESALSVGEIFGVYALVMVVTIIPLSMSSPYFSASIGVSGSTPMPSFFFA